MMMQGGTYARALEVGFTDNQAAFMAHLGMDTKQEAVDCVLEELYELEQERAENSFSYEKVGLKLYDFLINRLVLGFLWGLIVAIIITELSK